MNAAWDLRSDPERHPVRYLAGLWEQRTHTRLTNKEFGQLRDLHKDLAEFTRDVIVWMANAVNWHRFCHQVRAESGIRSTPFSPHLGFLLKHRKRALKLMCRELEHSTVEAAKSFCTRLDQQRANDLRVLLVVFADGRGDWLARITAAETLTDLQRLFIDLVDATTPVPPANVSDKQRQIAPV